MDYLNFIDCSGDSLDLAPLAHGMLLIASNGHGDRIGLEIDIETMRSLIEDLLRHHDDISGPSYYDLQAVKKQKQHETFNRIVETTLKNRRDDGTREGSAS